MVCYATTHTSYRDPGVSWKSKYLKGKGHTHLANGTISFFFVQSNIPLYISHIYFIYSSIHGHDWLFFLLYI